MKRNLLILACALAVAIYPGSLALHAQHGVGGGVGVGGGAGVGVGGGLGNHGGLGAGVGTNTGVSAGAKAGGSGASVNTHSNAGASATMASTNPGDVLDHNTQLSGRLENMLGLSGPAALATLKTDAGGFKNFGQFMAAVHVSHNLDIPFAELQAKMTGKDAVSLGKAIQELKPDADVKNAVKKANAEAKADADAKTETSASAS
jgi:hypothetical protein